MVAARAGHSRRSDFPGYMQIASCWADCDAYVQGNNAIYRSLFDTALTTLAIPNGVSL